MLVILAELVGRVVVELTQPLDGAAQTKQIQEPVLVTAIEVAQEVTVVLRQLVVAAPVLMVVMEHLVVLVDLVVLVTNSLIFHPTEKVVFSLVVEEVVVTVLRTLVDLVETVGVVVWPLFLLLRTLDFILHN